MTEDKEKSKREGKKAASKLRDNADNPVLIGNAVAITALGGFLSFGAYKKYSAGQLSWKVAGAWAGAVGLFAAGDYFLSQYLFKKYPPK
ncbi:hypothetical protein BDY21DRAFT_59100 [Lineolata rhizophorae]|uniref:Uncharacterized protein n=1 Tax=Lineolata rhizophorae TaxID=578093 RepID=A0A6A6NXS1_9PEZI|nr:hypothetical protein BDY21DRAFT_59100 [Lineolata rhizophorae]